MRRRLSECLSEANVRERRRALGGPELSAGKSWKSFAVSFQWRLIVRFWTIS